MTVMMADIVPLEIASGGNLIAIKPFTITVEFVNEYNIIVVDKIIAKFKDEGRDVTVRWAWKSNMICLPCR